MANESRKTKNGYRFYSVTQVELERAMEILGVKSGYDTSEIKSAYRALVKEYHPDMSPLSKGYNKFIEVQEAYNTLSLELNTEQLGGFEESFPKEESRGFEGFSFEKISRKNAKIIKYRYN